MMVVPSRLVRSHALVLSPLPSLRALSVRAGLGELSGWDVAGKMPAQGVATAILPWEAKNVLRPQIAAGGVEGWIVRLPFYKFCMESRQFSLCPLCPDVM